MKIRLRAAVPADIPRIHALVYELAVFEKEPQEVTTTPELYMHDCFTDKRFEVTVAEDTDADNLIAGIALTYWAYSSWKGKYLWLDDLIVTESYRGSGIGHLLFESCMQKALDENAALFKWQVLDWNEAAIRFYDKYDTEYQKSWITCKLSANDMHNIITSLKK